MRLLTGICAAGNSTRMGFDKLTTSPSLHSPDTLMTRVVAAVPRTDFVVALPPEDHRYYAARKSLLRPYDRSICVADPDQGIAETLKLLAQTALAEEYDGLIILMADLPFLTRSHVESVIKIFEAFDGERVVRATCTDGDFGYPVILPAKVLPEFEALTGEQRVGVVLANHSVKRVNIGSKAACMHVNTPEDWRKI
ncbi:nucleotidyltransferase family protein [Celeribacter litoreus]|uniref:nucleotidyltransferase family protein n=1 Tax=Celeribacter litoreus TaxID=2876714 RepID=UPI001CCB28AC|nr:NTP transferase domain-containing protein [Celeribacter litoreus]MCA0043823.1 NTP transferase domain-containing protein [Celeribacter litoreus]